MTIVLAPANFVLQRRIVRPFAESQCTIANPAVFGAGSVLAEGPSGSLVLDGPFRRIVLDPRATWIADASLTMPCGKSRGTRPGRRIAAVQVEIGPWSADDTELLLRPVARAPHLWSGRRLRNYFEAAHAAADALTALLLHGEPVRVRSTVDFADGRLPACAYVLSHKRPNSNTGHKCRLAPGHSSSSEADRIHVQTRRPR